MCLLLPHHALASCLPASTWEAARVSYVYDGDTVKLDDNRRVRLAGINSPETSHRGNPVAEPFAQESRTALSKLLASANNRIRLHLTPARRDRHGRWIADIVLEGGQNPAEILIKQGLAVQAAVGDESQNPLAFCYKEAEQQARRNKAGLWQSPSFWLSDSTRLSKTAKRFAIVRDRIRHIKSQRNSWLLTLEHGTLVSIARDAWPDGHAPQLDATIEARGWLYRQNDTPTLRITHAANLITGTPQP